MNVKETFDILWKVYAETRAYNFLSCQCWELQISPDWNLFHLLTGRNTKTIWQWKIGAWEEKHEKSSRSEYIFTPPERGFYCVVALFIFIQSCKSRDCGRKSLHSSSPLDQQWKRWCLQVVWSLNSGPGSSSGDWWEEKANVIYLASFWIADSSIELLFLLKMINEAPQKHKCSSSSEKPPD